MGQSGVKWAKVGENGQKWVKIIKIQRFNNIFCHKEAKPVHK